MMKTKGEILKEIRKYSGITLRQLGEKLGCSEFTIRRYESGKAELTEEIIGKICDNCKMDRRVFDEPENMEKYCHYIPEKVDYKAIGKRVRELREAKGMNREECGKRTGCSESVIAKIDLNYSNGSDTILQRIADTFEVGFEWLKYGDEKTHISPVNKKLIEWLNDNQKVRDALWKEMREAERN